MFVHACFVAELNNDPGIKKRHWDRLYRVLDKSIGRLIRYFIHYRRGPE